MKKRHIHYPWHWECSACGEKHSYRDKRCKCISKNKEKLIFKFPKILYRDDCEKGTAYTVNPNYVAIIEGKKHSYPFSRYIRKKYKKVCVMHPEDKNNLRLQHFRNLYEV